MALSVPIQRIRRGGSDGSVAATRGLVGLYLSIIVLIPLAAVSWRSVSDGLDAFWGAVTDSEALSALWFSVAVSLIVTAINAVMGTVVAWVLVRDDFRGKRVVNALIDLPFALPTIVAGLTLIALYGQQSPIGVNVAYTRVGVALALLFVTVPFVVRGVQPVLETLDREAEEAAAALGATPAQTLRRIVLPALAPAILSSSALGFARAVGEFGSIVLISGNIPFNTETASVRIFGLVESDAVASASAVSVVLLLISLVVLVSINAVGWWRARYER